MAVERIFFQTSLPRSGSTLLQNVLAQNPDIYSTPTSALMDLLYSARTTFTLNEEFRFHLEQDLVDRCFTSFCRQAIQGYVDEMTDRKYFIDKNRGWGVYIRWVEKFLPYKPKMICMVRDLRDVFCSMEMNFRKNPNKEHMVDWMNLKNTTVPKRIDHWANGVPVGISLERMESIMQLKDDHKFLFVKYEDFCLNPEREMSRIYNYLEIPYYSHNFDEIPQLTHESDNHHFGMGDHIIRNTLEMKPSKAQDVLGRDVCDWITARYKWFYDYFKYDV